jgi:hypothetical protein
MIWAMIWVTTWAMIWHDKLTAKSRQLKQPHAAGERKL